MVLLLILRSALHVNYDFGNDKSNKPDIFSGALLCASEMVQYNLLTVMEGELLITKPMKAVLCSTTLIQNLFTNFVVETVVVLECSV